MCFFSPGAGCLSFVALVAGCSLVRCKSAHIRQSYVDFFIFLFFICPENDWVQICFKVIVCNVRWEIDDRVADRIKICKLPPLLRFYFCYQPLVGTSELSGTVISFCPRSSGPDPPPFLPPPLPPTTPFTVARAGFESLGVCGQRRAQAGCPGTVRGWSEASARCPAK